MSPKGIKPSPKVKLFTNTMIAPPMQLLLQLIKRTIKTKAIRQVYRSESFSSLSGAVLALLRAKPYSLIQKMTGRSY